MGHATAVGGGVRNFKPSTKMQQLSNTQLDTEINWVQRQITETREGLMPNPEKKALAEDALSRLTMTKELRG